MCPVALFKPFYATNGSYCGHAISVNFLMKYINRTHKNFEFHQSAEGKNSDIRWLIEGCVWNLSTVHKKKKRILKFVDRLPEKISVYPSWEKKTIFQLDVEKISNFVSILQDETICANPSRKRMWNLIDDQEEKVHNLSQSITGKQL